MKALILAVCAMAFSLHAMADCQLVSSQQKLSYGRMSAAERQAEGNRLIEMPEKQIVLNVICDEPSRIRLFLGSNVPKGHEFGFGDNGVMRVTAAQATVDDRTVNLAAIHAGDPWVTNGGVREIAPALNEGIAFINGQELRGKTASVTFTIKPRFKSNHITDREVWRGNLRVRMDVQ